MKFLKQFDLLLIGANDSFSASQRDENSHDGLQIDGSVDLNKKKSKDSTSAKGTHRLISYCVKTETFSLRNKLNIF